MLSTLTSADFYNQILRVTTPILFATLAGGIAGQSGVTNMALEGIMLFCALFGVIFSSMTGSFVFGLLLTVLLGAFIGAFLAFFVLNMKTDEILAAIAINLMAEGGTIVLMMAYCGDKASTQAGLGKASPDIIIPGLSKIPFIGEILFSQNFLTYLAFIMVIVMHVLLYKTPLGLKIRAVGENKNAAESVGISSVKIKYIALILSGVLCSFGGYFMSGAYMHLFSKGMVSGRGFIALAASSMANNTPVGGMLVSLLFGIADPISNKVQLMGFPKELGYMLPYAVVLIGLALFSYSQMKKRQRLAGK